MLPVRWFEVFVAGCILEDSDDSFYPVTEMPPEVMVSSREYLFVSPIKKTKEAQCVIGKLSRSSSLFITTTLENDDTPHPHRNEWHLDLPVRPFIITKSFVDICNL